MVFDNLKKLHIDMCSKGETRCIFAIKILGKGFSCIFISDTDPFRFYITSLGENPFTIEYKVLKNYKINTYLGEKLELLLKHLNITYNSYEDYIPKGFVREINAQIPIAFKDKPTYSQVLSINPRNDIEEADKKYFCGWRNNPSTDRVSILNYNKTLEAFGQTIAEEARKQNASSRWTDNPNEERLQELNHL